MRAIYPHGGLLDLPAAEWDRIFDVNLRAPFLVTRELAQPDDRRGAQGLDRQHLVGRRRGRCATDRCRTARRRRRWSG